MIPLDPPPKRIGDMRTYRLTHLQDSVLLRNLSTLVAQDRSNTATLLAHLAEVDERRLYLPAGYPSMYAFCLGELHLSEDAAYTRIGAARTARQFPALLEAIADGRIHLTAVRLLSPHLTPGNADELIAAATHKGRADIELWLARRFPRAEALRLDDGISPLAQVRPAREESAAQGDRELGLGQVEPSGGSLQSAERPVEVPAPATRLVPLTPERFALQVTIPRATHDKLRYAQSLLGHSIPSGDIACVLDRALDALIGRLEKQKLGATRRALRQHPRPTRAARHVPAHVRRAVWERDGGQCTFLGAHGRRCGERTRLEFDHVDPVARGGRATVERMRLRCRAHNQFEAERAFGAEFMRGKRSAAARRSAATGTADKPNAMSPRPAQAIDEQTLDVIAGLHGLGMRAAEARRLAQASRPDRPVSLEERLRLALRAHRARRVVQVEGRPSVPGGALSAPLHTAAGP
jgi:5-methylcytosine-specific restriction endonuclease McrA